MDSTVFLIGAGPGDPGLLTVKGKECLENANVVVYDRNVTVKGGRPCLCPIPDQGPHGIV